MDIKELFEQTCRSCMRNGRKLISISERMVNSATVCQNLSTIIPQIRIAINDELPQFICGLCVKKLNEARRFTEMCVTTDEHLHTMLIEYKRSNMTINPDPVIIEQDPLINNECPPVNHCRKMEVSDSELTNFDLESLLEIEVDRDKMNKSDNLPQKAKDDISDMDSLVERAVTEMETLRRGRSKTKYAPQPHILCTHSDTRMNEIEKSGVRTNKCAKIDVCHERFETRNSSHWHKRNHAHTQLSSDRYKSLAFTQSRRESSAQRQRQRNAIGLNEASVKCDICSRCFETFEHLTEHQRRAHTEQQKVRCHLCNTSFTLKEQLIEHLNQHDMLPSFVCIHCDKAFQQNGDLEVHLRTHTAEMPFLCSECGKVFKNGSNLHQHQLRHSGERRYQCPECPKRFPCKSDQLKHMSMHRTTKPHVCDICGSSFTRSYTLANHKHIHTGERPYKCDECNMTFVFVYHMRRHMKTHTGEKPYKCTFCDREYAASGDLNKHMRTHVGEKTYRCGQCQEAFKYQAELRIHQTQHYKDGNKADA